MDRIRNRNMSSPRLLKNTLGPESFIGKNVPNG